MPVKIYVGESEAGHRTGVTAKGLERDAFRMVSGNDWLALVGNDVECEPREPWARHHGQWLAEKKQEWEHSYYQIVVNPAGAVIDLDRAVTLSQAYEWSSQAEVASHVDKDYWSVELRLPATSSDEDPLHQMIGSRPFQANQMALDSGKGTSLPWYFNLFRKRSGAEGVETTAFSPLGPDAKSFHVPLLFSKIYVR